MTIFLAKSSEVKPGDLLENADQVWRPVKSIEKQAGRLYFIFEFRRDTRTSLIDDVLLVGRG